MGYMGFGMKKEVYTRKPKTPFARAKQLYGEKLEHYTSTYPVPKLSSPKLKLSAEQSEVIKAQIRATILKENKRKRVINVLTILSAIVLAVVVWIALDKFLTYFFN